MWSGRVLDGLARQVANEIGPGAGNVFVAHSQVVGEELDNLHIQHVAAARDEVGVGHAQVTQDAAFADILEIVGENARYDKQQGDRNDAKC